MNKKVLAAIPRPAVKKRYEELLKIAHGIKGIVTAEKLLVDGAETLIINCFQPHKKSVIPWFRTFCQKEEYITQDLTTDRIKWRTAAFNYIVGFCMYDWYRSESKLILSTPRDGKIIKDFIKDFLKTTHSDRCDAGFEFEDYIYAYQADIREKKLAEKHRKICEQIDARMSLFGKLPDDYQQFIEKQVFDECNYFFYSRKEGWAYCTRCGHDYEIRKDGIYHRRIPIWNNRDKLKHNYPIICPHCNKSITAKSDGYGKGSLLEVNWSVLIQTSGDDVLVRYFCHSKDYRSDYRHPEITSTEMFRTIHTAESVENYEWEEYHFNHKLRWCYPRAHGWSWNPSEFQVPRRTVLYNKDFGLLNRTCMKYSCMGEFIDHIYPLLHRPSAWIVDNYLNFYHQYPFVEQMIKIGWYSLVKELFEDNGKVQREHSTYGRSILETCGINRDQFLLLKEATGNNPKARDFRIVKYAAEQGIRLTLNDLKELRLVTDNGYFDFFKYFIDAMKYTTLHKLTRYLTEQKITHEKDYFDYTGWLLEMKYDMKNEFNLYPRNFIAKHDEMANIYQRFKDKQHREDIKKFNRLLKEMRAQITEDNPLNLQIGGLFIRLPHKVDELKTEGETLHHCVGTYIDKVLKGETSIFFVRKIEKPDEPYYTLEWKNHRVAQCRGSHNCDMTPEVKAFTSLFEEQMKNYELRRKAG